MNYFLYLLVIFSFASIYSQKRELGLNIQGSKSTLFAELSYKKIVEKNILIESGIGFGNFGRFEKSNDNNKFSSVTPFSPYYLWTNQSGEPYLYIEQKYKLNNIGGKFFFWNRFQMEIKFAY